MTNDNWPLGAPNPAALSAPKVPGPTWVTLVGASVSRETSCSEKEVRIADKKPKKFRAGFGQKAVSLPPHPGPLPKGEGAL